MTKVLRTKICEDVMTKYMKIAKSEQFESYEDLLIQCEQLEQTLEKNDEKAKEKEKIKALVDGLESLKFAIGEGICFPNVEEARKSKVGEFCNKIIPFLKKVIRAKQCQQLDGQLQGLAKQTFSYLSSWSI